MVNYNNETFSQFLSKPEIKGHEWEFIFVLVKNCPFIVLFVYKLQYP